MHFNLITEPWIPVLRVNGETDRVGIWDALTRASTIRQIAGSNPMDNVALLRLLLAVLQWCKPVLPKNKRYLTSDRHGLPLSWLTKLQQSEVLFDLFGDPRGFMQAPSESATNERPIADLFHEFPGRSNVAHLRHIRDYRDGVCPACFAMGLVRLPVMMTAKGSGKRPGINGIPPLYFVPFGPNLAETLSLNWPLPAIQGDMPCWASSSAKQEQDTPIGPMEGFTWTSRQFSIHRESLSSGRCSLCGDQSDALITRLKELNQPNGRVGLTRSNNWKDPHVFRASAKNNRLAANTLDQLPTAEGQWRDWLEAILPEEGGTNHLPPAVEQALRRTSPKKLKILVTGLATKNNDKYIESVECTFSLSWILEEANTAEKVTDGLNTMKNLVRNCLDPFTSRWKNPVGKLGGAKFLNFIAAHKGQKLHGLRSALAIRLPTVEWRVLRAVATTSHLPEELRHHYLTLLCRNVLNSCIRSTTAGSPLRRLEMARKTGGFLDDFSAD